MKLDEYWVASFFVQLPENKSHGPRFLLAGVSAVVAVAVIVLLAFATAVRAETTTVAPAPSATAGGTLAPIEQTQPEPAVEPVPAAPEPETTEVAALATESGGEAEEAGSATPQTDAVTDLAEPEPPSSASLDQPLRSKIGAQVPTESGTRVAASTERVTTLPAEAGRDVSKLDAKPVARITRSVAAQQEAVPTPAPIHLGPTQETLRDTTSASLERLFGLAEEARIVGALGELVGSVESLALAPEAGAPFAATPTTLTPIDTHVFFPRPALRLAGKPLVGPAEVEPRGLLAEHRSGFDVAGLSRPGANGGHEGADSARPFETITPWSADGLARSSEPTNERVPGPAPSRSPGESVDGVGSASPSFVPLVALLALLALVAPAGSRRLREAPGFRAPTPFVCALERPG